jgi:predicted ATPase/class 3 adenylate cyclase
LDSSTFLFTDIEDSTALWEREAAAMQIAIARHHMVVSEAITQFGGRVYKNMGDGVCAVFAQAECAVSAALALRHALTTESWATTEPLRVRVAIASGEARLLSDDYFGPAINLVARLLSLCPGGRTLLSVGAAASIEDVSIATARVAHLGWYRLKGIEEPVEVSELTTQVALGVPPPDSEKAYRVVRIADRWRPVHDIPNNLAPARDRFIGRETALRELAERLERMERLITLLGPGGVGKTRLVRHYGTEWLGRWPGGVYFCDLSDARSLDGIHFAVSMALGVPLVRGDAGVQLGHAIAGRGPCLVILDNFEQVQKHAAATVGRWLDHAAEAHFVVTSRERLQLVGETVFSLDPMEVIRDGLALFEARGREQRSDFAIDDTNRAVVAEIVRLLDGLPLAIELAAARIRVLSPAQIADRMKDRFVLLAGARRVAARQETLRAAIDWSWDLLASWERLALAQCSIFDGGFSLAAAEGVLNLPADAPPIVDVIQGLIDKSLVRASLPKSPVLHAAEPYFGMYISVHEYTSEKLRDLGDACRIATEQRHGSYFARLGSDAAIDALTTHGGIARRHSLALELDNLLTACRRAIARGDADTAAACFLAAFAVLETQGPFTVAETLGRSVAALNGLAPAQRAKILNAGSHAMFAGGHPESANAALDEALAAARAARDRYAEATALRHLAVVRHLTGHRDQAQDYFSEALALYGPNDRSQRGVLLANLANLQMEWGRIDEAKDSYHAALDLHRQVGNRNAEGIALGNLGTLHHELGQGDEARAAYEGALAIHCESGNVLQRAITLGNLGLLLHQHGDHEQGVAHYQTALSLHREIGNRRGIAVILKQMGEAEHTLGHLVDAEARFHEALAIFREIGNRRFEGGVLGDMGAIMVDRGTPREALELIEESEEIFRQIEDPLSLASALCAKGHALVDLGDGEAARAALSEADAIAISVGVKNGSLVHQRVNRLREALRGT